MSIVTSSAGFIGSSFVIGCLGRYQEPVTHPGVLACADNLENPARLQGDAQHSGARVEADRIVRFHDQYGRA